MQLTSRNLKIATILCGIYTAAVHAAPPTPHHTAIIQVEGRGVARGSSGQQRLMAMRAADVVAHRNAIACAQQNPMTFGHACPPTAAMRNGGMQSSGRVRGARVIERRWLPDADPPQARVVIEVPVSGICVETSSAGRGGNFAQRFR